MHRRLQSGACARPLNSSVRRLAVRRLVVVNAIAALVNGLVWLGLAWGGWGMLRGLEIRLIPGYPNRGQFIYYLYFPLAMATSALLLYAVARFSRFKALVLVAQSLLFLVLFPFMLAYTGGM
jgi:hypothetical protein